MAQSWLNVSWLLSTGMCIDCLTQRYERQHAC